ncbi:CybS-domain-containing protein [Xylariomycetidae sp. FL0641]|nr:CybS-domain-containing protein [Xylariomycetidae sp. FL0641]
MASALRPTLLRQTGLAAAATRPAVSVPVAAFHASSRRSLIPPGPQVIKGTVNDPAYVPPPSPTHGSYHWTFDRVIAAGLIPLSVAPFAAGSLNPGTDAVLCALLLIHSHTGLQSIVTDYVPKSRFPKARTSATWLVNAATALVGLGLYEFETNDVGITETVKRVWKA